MTNTNRPTGATVQLLDLEKLTAIWAARQPDREEGQELGFLASGLITNSKGEIHTINTEGVQDYNNSDGKGDGVAVYTFWGWLNFSEEELKASLTGETIDLADFVRTFGSRLEVNFGLAYDWTQK
jgi:hypothetical protein